MGIMLLSSRTCYSGFRINVVTETNIPKSYLWCLYFSIATANKENQNESVPERERSVVDKAKKSLNLFLNIKVPREKNGTSKLKAEKQNPVKVPKVNKMFLILYDLLNGMKRNEFWKWSEERKWASKLNTL